MNLIRAQFSFEKWGIDFVGTIKRLAKRTQEIYIIVAIHYMNKWVESWSTSKSNANITTKLLYECILIRFGCLIKIISDKGTHFINQIVEILTYEFVI